MVHCASSAETKGQWAASCQAAALSGGRYKWWHDKVLRVLANILEREMLRERQTHGDSKASHSVSHGSREAVGSQKDQKKNFKKWHPTDGTRAGDEGGNL